MAFRDWQKPRRSPGKVLNFRRMGWPSRAWVVRKALPGVPREVTLVETPPGVDEAGRGPGRKFHGFWNGDLETPRREVAARVRARKEAKVTVQGRFTCWDARERWGRSYPK